MCFVLGAWFFVLSAWCLVLGEGIVFLCYLCFFVASVFGIVIRAFRVIRLPAGLAIQVS